jgi:hypothetical protein
VSSISISLVLMPLMFKKRTIARCSIWHVFLSTFAKHEGRHDGAPYRSRSVNLILLDPLFRKVYWYGLISSPLPTDEKQQTMSGTYRPYVLISHFRVFGMAKFLASPAAMGNAYSAHLPLGNPTRMVFTWNYPRDISTWSEFLQDDDDHSHQILFQNESDVTFPQSVVTIR